jgi:hypothetical protein
MYFEDTGLLLAMVGFRRGRMRFHPTLLTVGLLKTPEAPLAFASWVEQLLNDWCVA